MKLKILKELLKYSDQYVALSEKRDAVIAAGHTINELEKKLKKLNVTNVSIEYISPTNAYISPLCL